MTAWTPEVRERLDVLSRNADAQRALVGAASSINWGNDTPRVGDVRAALAHIAALEASLAAERESNDRNCATYARRVQDALDRAEKAEARVAVLAAECRAWRESHEARSAYEAKWMRARMSFGIGSFSEENDLHNTENAARTARAATDAAGALEGGSRG